MTLGELVSGTTVTSSTVGEGEGGEAGTARSYLTTAVRSGGLAGLVGGAALLRGVLAIRRGRRVGGAVQALVGVGALALAVVQWRRWSDRGGPGARVEESDVVRTGVGDIEDVASGGEKAGRRSEGGGADAARRSPGETGTETRAGAETTTGTGTPEAGRTTGGGPGTPGDGGDSSVPDAEPEPAVDESVDADVDQEEVVEGSTDPGGDEENEDRTGGD